MAHEFLAAAWEDDAIIHADDPTKSFPHSDSTMHANSISGGTRPEQFREIARRIGRAAFDASARIDDERIVQMD